MTVIRLMIWAVIVVGSALGAMAIAPKPNWLWFIIWLAVVSIAFVVFWRSRKHPEGPLG